MKYLRLKQYYIDLYDKITVNHCRRIEELHKDYKAPDYKKNKISQKQAKNITAWIRWLHFFYETGERWEKKDQTINKWMERDRERDELLENAVAPTNIECLTCRSITSPETKFLHTWGSDNKDRVLFMYKCPNGCLPMRSFFEDGTEHISEPKLCPKCRTELESKNKRENKDRAIIIEKCLNCNYSNKEVFDLKQKKEKPDKNFAKDRNRFCITEEQGQKYLEEKSRFQQMMELAKEFEEKLGKGKKEKKELEIKVLTLPELDKLLGPVIKKSGYIKFKLGEPQIDRDVVVSFQVQDGKNRSERTSSDDLKKLLKKTLNGTNWHVMSDGVYYKLGVLSGRLRGKEREGHS